MTEINCRGFKMAFVLLIAGILFAAPANAGANPDGRIFHPSITMEYGALLAHHPYYEARNANLVASSVQIPVAHKFTVFAGYSFASHHIARHFGHWGGVFHSKSIESIGSLKNPDGAVGGFIVSTAMAYGVQDDDAAGDLSLGMAYIVNNHLTLTGGYQLFVKDIKRSQSVSLGARLHWKRIEGSSNFNPDGAVGSLTVVPSVALVRVEKEGGIGAAVTGIFPIAKFFSSAIHYDVAHVPGNRTTVQTVGIGLKFHM